MIKTNKIIALLLAMLLLGEGAFSNVAKAAEPEADLDDEIVTLQEEPEDEPEAEIGGDDAAETENGLRTEDGDGTVVGDGTDSGDGTVPEDEEEPGEEALTQEGDDEGDEVVSTQDDIEKSYDIKVLLTSGLGEFELDETAYYDEDENILIHADKDGSFSDFIRFEDTDGDGTSEKIACTELMKPKRDGYSFIGYYITETRDFSDESDVSSEYLVTEDTLIKDLLDREDLTYSEEDEEVIVLFPAWLANEAEPELEEDPDEAKEPVLTPDVDEENTEDELEAKDPDEAEVSFDEGKKNDEVLNVIGSDDILPAPITEEELEASLFAESVSDPQDVTLMMTGDAPEGVKSGFWIDGIPGDDTDAGFDFIPELTYTGEAIPFKEWVVVKNGDKTVPASDYTLAVKNDKNVGTGSITVTLKNNYSGKLPVKYFKIIPADFEIKDKLPQGESEPYSFNAQDVSVAYNGKAQKSVPVVTFISSEGKEFTLKNGTDYTVEYPGTGAENDYIGTPGGGESYPVIITGKGNFTGQLFADVNILPRNLVSINKAKVTVNATADTQDLDDVKVNVNVVINNAAGSKLSPEAYEALSSEEKKSIQYIYSVDYNLDTATGTVVITGTGDLGGLPDQEGATGYFGTRTVSFKIGGTIPISKAKFYTEPASIVYDGTHKAQIVEYNGALLGSDQYEVTYKNNNDTNAGTITATYKGKGGFSGSVNKSFKIAPFDISKDEGGKFIVYFEDGLDEFNYSKGGVKPRIVVKFVDGDGVEQPKYEGTDYTLTYSNNTQVGNTAKKPFVTIKGKGNFTGSRKLEFSIKKQDISAVTAVAADKVFVNKRGNFTTTVTLTDADKKKLVANTDYDKTFKYYYTEPTILVDGQERDAGDVVDSSDAVPVGTTLKVEIEGKGAYEGRIAATFRLTGADISKASIRVYNQYFDGEPVLPDYSQVEVKLAGVILNGGEDYIIDSFSGNDRKGTATLTVKGIGDYGGSKTAKFSILAKSTNFTVVFNGNGSTSGKMNNMTVAAGKPANLTANKFARSGYAFKGWKLTATGDSVVYADKAEINNSGEVSGRTLVLYAHWEAKENTATYHLNGWRASNTWLQDEGVTLNGSYYSKTFTADSATFTLNVPAEKDWQEGYQFGGWYQDSDYKTRIFKIKKGTARNLDIYAKWVPYSYNVVFNGNGATKGSMQDEAFSYGISKALRANSFQRTGQIEGPDGKKVGVTYRFAGWSTTKYDAGAPAALAPVMYSDKQVVADIDDGDGDTVLYAVWRLNDFNLEFVSNGGSEIPATTYVYKQGLDSLPVPTRDGYQFGGWFSDASLKKQVKSIGKNVYGDMTLYAKWNPNKFTLRYLGGEGSTGKTAGRSYTYADQVKLSDSSFAKNGYEFRGWSLSDNATEPDYKAMEEVGAKALLEAAAGVQEVDALAQNQTVTLYAVWKQWLPDSQENVGKGYKVIFDKNQPDIDITVTGKMSDQKLVYGTGKKLTKNAYKLKGYTFRGWTTEENGTEVEYTDAALVYGVGDEYPVDGTVKLYALWELDEYHITYDNVDDLDNSKYPETYTVHDSVTLYDVSTLGKTFLGWFPNAKLSGKPVSSIAKGSTGDKSFFAKWKNTQYTVTYDLNAGGDSKAKLNRSNTGYTASYKYSYDSGYLLATAERDGYSFEGWYSDAKCRKYVGYYITSPNSDITLYAKWKPYPYKYNIRFLENGENVKGDMKVMTGLKIGTYYKLTNNTFVNEGYVFDHWVQVSDPEDIANSVVYENGNAITFSNRKQVLDLSRTDGDTVYLAAVWKLIEYNIRYLDTDGSVIEGMTPVTYNYESEDINPELENAGEDNPGKVPVKVGFTFAGWYLDKKLTQRAADPVIPHHSKGDITLYARWYYEIEDLPDDTTGCINVVDYGAIPDDDQLDNNGINEAIEYAYRRASADNRQTVYVPAGEYRIEDRDRHSIKLRSYVNLMLDPDAVLHVVERNKIASGDGMIGANAEHDIIVSGGKLVGGRSFYTEDEYGHGINILGSSNITIANMEICDNWGDGIYIGYTNGAGCSNINIINCNIHYNRRNNITVTYGDHILIDGCRITDARGTAPQAGICVEPNDDHFHVCDDIYIKNTVITTPDKGNWQFRSYHAYNGGNRTIATNVVFDNCRITGWFSNWYQPRPKFINGTTLDGYFDPGA